MMLEEVMRAIFNGDTEKFDEIVRKGVDVKVVTDNEKWNLLHRALISVSIPPIPKMIKHLIDLGIDVNAKDCYGNTPLHYAARLKNIELIGMLLSAGAEIDPVNKDGLTPLRLMLLKKPHNLEAIEFFLSHGADINQRVKGGIAIKEYIKIISSGENHAIVELFDKYEKKHDEK